MSDSTITPPVLMPHSTNHNSVLDSGFASEQPPVGDTPSHLIPETYSAFNTPSLSGSSSTHLLVSNSVNESSVPDYSLKVQNPVSNHKETPNSSSADQGLASLVAQEPYYPDSIASSDKQINSQVTTKDTNSVPHQKYEQPQQRSNTFFSDLPHKFTDVLFLADNGIPTDQFLKACEDTLPFFSKYILFTCSYIECVVGHRLTKCYSICSSKS